MEIMGIREIMMTMETTTIITLTTSRKTLTMKMKGVNKHLAAPSGDNKEVNDLQGYPAYPAKEDIYCKYREEKDIDPENISMSKEIKSIGKTGSSSEKILYDNISGRDLDIPGSELDDKMEDIGSEDEENNYYSIGGDDHDNLDEYKGE